MKIAIFTDGPNLAAHVAHRVGTAKWLLLIDTDSGELEAVPYPAVTSAQGTGVKAIALAVNLGAQVILTGQVNAVIARQFETKDIEILSGFKGS
ncbi:MAG: NifB/NifX family molybdenum-iron cluster-binding protein, partial [Syntrophales bacterium]|nr:NifB/NifX family molybdenum-iron cluster-binding protein [Syntrophales bacterium]